jgi:serine/threonine protein kinase
MSPELFSPDSEDHRPTKYSDCYALGMVIYEVISGNLPFFQLATRAIPPKILRGDRPERPQGAEGVQFTDEVWEVLGFCWMAQPKSRPSIEGVLQCLKKASRSWKPPSLRLPTVLSTANSLAQGLSDIITVEIADGSDASPLPQPSEKLDQEESTGIINQVNYPLHITG